MKKIILAISPLIAVGGILSSGCAPHRHEAVVVTSGPPLTETTTRRTVVVNEEPPPPRVEAPTAPPSETQVWISGYWNYTDDRWVWIPGHWEERPRPSATWVPGHWDPNPNGRGWVWTRGYWE